MYKSETAKRRKEVLRTIDRRWGVNDALYVKPNDVSCSDRYRVDRDVRRYHPLAKIKASRTQIQAIGNRLERSNDNSGWATIQQKSQKYRCIRETDREA